MSGAFIITERDSRHRRGRVRHRGPGHPRRRLLALKRLGILIAAIAVPALAAENPLAGFASAEPEAQLVQPMGFETLGESFPGSAFYYLEDAPQPGEADLQFAHASTRAPDSATAPASTLFDAGPAARALIATGTDSDVARAQRCLTMAVYYEAASESDVAKMPMRMKSSFAREGRTGRKDR